MREGTFALGASAWLVGWWSIFLGLMGANLMKAAQMPLELAAAHPVLTLDSSITGAASADLVKINKLVSLVGTKLACLTGRALKAGWHASWLNWFYPGVPAGQKWNGLTPRISDAGIAMESRGCVEGE